MKIDISQALAVTGLDQNQLFDLLCIPPNLLYLIIGRSELDAEADHFTLAMKQAIMEVSELVEAALRCFGEANNARSWFNHTVMALDGHRPKDVIFVDGGIREVRELIGRIEYNIYS